MSRFVQLLRGAPKSKSVRFAGLFGTIWTIIASSDFLRETISANPEYAAILGGVQAVIAIINRFQTNNALDEK
jgi:hypothetical protein